MRAHRIQMYLAHLQKRNRLRRQESTNIVIHSSPFEPEMDRLAGLRVPPWITRLRYRPEVRR